MIILLILFDKLNCLSFANILDPRTAVNIYISCEDLSSLFLSSLASFPWQDFHNISHILFRFLDNTEKDCNLNLHCFFIAILCFISFSVRLLIKINFLCSRVVFCPIKSMIYKCERGFIIVEMFFLCHTELYVPLNCYISAVTSSGNAALLSAVSSFFISLSLLNKSFSLILCLKAILKSMIINEF